MLLVVVNKQKLELGLLWKRWEKGTWVEKTVRGISGPAALGIRVGAPQRQAEVAGFTDTLTTMK